MVSQSPIVRWTGAAVRFLYVHLGNARIMLRHVQRVMAQQRLKCTYVAARAEIRDAESVAKTMGGDTF